ncbi:MAG: hypothetical protein F6K19_42610 [Cyanothece sp. SIO1E1]|nr:hypothetical protein [Cyanothece sp. SIO1E1]
MTAISQGTDIPSNIDTLERMCAWSALAISNLNARLQYQESQGPAGTLNQASTGILQAADGTTRLIVRIAIPLDPAFETDATQKLWQFAGNVTDAVLPDAYKTN